MDRNEKILKGYSILVKGKQIALITKKKVKADEKIDARGKIVIPGFINCHHHLFQVGLRGNPALQNQPIDRWIKIVSNYATVIDEEIVYLSALVNMAELLLYGCTTTTDMHYIFPKGNSFIEATIKAAQDIGIRFHPYRGSMSLSKKDGAEFPDKAVEKPDDIATRTEAVITKYHNPDKFSMLRIGIAPCTIFTSRREDYKNALILAKKYDLLLQTHLGESSFENKYTKNKFGKRPLSFLMDLGWEGKNVSFVHGINMNIREIKELAQTNTHVVHCPISNARKPIGEEGVAPVYSMLTKGVNVAIGVDGSAGNDSSNVLEELRWARTLQGIRKDSTYLKPSPVMAMGTINGARLLGRETEIGSIEEGKAADLAIFDITDTLERVGSIYDPQTMLLACQATRADTVIVNGKKVVEKSQLINLDAKKIICKLNKRLKKLSY
ncbi:8-oxoguanine deaminase [Candidatus Roizmanbacteria bacterium CG_4_10_14_0_8_um_filter_33_9]|uniref:8-oxoguanine deaminase n=1 Tax=Candidatus Roizmanbacteria bacterium CG_4_10_14_0_8_um_filter_33_9 TaxID=1974826 RepID=A0A2M7QJF9_9BACT|nr:MAG: 8-oxoguanine deaminase [Candidatus Roizmanbacteria bacterium CG_4_10_14_0_8_um_filter_33_9]